MYDHVPHEAEIGPGMSVLDCGCGAGRFVRLATERGATVAGIDASRELVEIASDHTPEADLRVGDFEILPWADGSFDVVTGFSTFQFATDQVAALTEARRVSRGSVWVVVPNRLADSGIPGVFAGLTALFPPEELARLKVSGMFALSTPGKLEEVLAGAGLSAQHDETVEATVQFPDTGTAVAAFLSAGAAAIAIRHSGESAVERAVREALGPFGDDRGGVTLPGWCRVLRAG